MNPQQSLRREENNTISLSNTPEMSALPEWVRRLMMVVRDPAGHCLNVAAASFFAFCLIVSLVKLLYDFMLGIDFLGSVYGYLSEILMLSYAAWHAYHDGHVFMSCFSVKKLLNRFTFQPRFDVAVINWEERMRPYRYV